MLAAAGDLSHGHGGFFLVDLVDASLCSTADLRDRSAARASHPAPENMKVLAAGRARFPARRSCLLAVDMALGVAHGVCDPLSWACTGI